MGEVQGGSSSHGQVDQILELIIRREFRDSEKPATLTVYDDTGRVRAGERTIDGIGVSVVEAPPPIGSNWLTILHFVLLDDGALLDVCTTTEPKLYEVAREGKDWSIHRVRSYSTNHHSPEGVPAGDLPPSLAVARAESNALRNYVFGYRKEQTEERKKSTERYLAVLEDRLRNAGDPETRSRLEVEKNEYRARVREYDDSLEWIGRWENALPISSSPSSSK